jgi:hypothetical protein
MSWERDFFPEAGSIPSPELTDNWEVRFAAGRGVVGASRPTAGSDTLSSWASGAPSPARVHLRGLLENVRRWL